MPLSASGEVSIYDGSKGALDVIVDVAGYDGAGAAGTGLYNALTPARICDTRASQPANQCTAKTLGPKGTLPVQASGANGVPADATAVVLNVTAADETASGYLTVFPAGQTMPVASDLNFTPGTPVANLGVAPLGSTGSFGVYNSAGRTDIIVDLVGWYS